ncbi:hypothetical protein K1T71_012453 [Dendrolimus kikuchii]|uniref:Uncharacterized protein n=1 Tax=Dendrolimus kikuchii TaxID=765133 RepID=A0ACC1CJE4_9NEOP|nr:hypothetical protein K1T71_012453 [Dendrolimus kikuchii]
MDLDRQRRALSVRSNMLARRFARCSDNVKMLLFKTYCTTIYTCELWCKYTKAEYSALRVQYNNALRIMLRLPKFCSASEMFTETRLPGFAALIRQRVANTRERFYNSQNKIVAALLQINGPLIEHWMKLHSDISIF